MPGDATRAIDPPTALTGQHYDGTHGRTLRQSMSDGHRVIESADELHDPLDDYIYVDTSQPDLA